MRGEAPTAAEIAAARAQFPSLHASDWVGVSAHVHMYTRSADTAAWAQLYADNAGGSQVLRTVAERVAEYLLTSNVQLVSRLPRARYPPILTTLAYRVRRTHRACMRRRGSRKAIRRPRRCSTHTAPTRSFRRRRRPWPRTTLPRPWRRPSPPTTRSSLPTLTTKARAVWPGAHADAAVPLTASAANVGAWVRMAAARGATVKHWELDRATLRPNLDALRTLLSPRTRLGQHNGQRSGSASGVLV
jgi:hypothetical protein